MKHWALGGRTELSNLISLCRFHHRAVHEEGFEVRRNLDGSLLVPVRTSTGTIDYTEYDCTLVQGDGAWEVEECLVTITT